MAVKEQLLCNEMTGLLHKKIPRTICIYAVWNGGGSEFPWRFLLSG